MAKAVLDSTVLVSAFLKPSAVGVAAELLRLASKQAYRLYLSESILGETADVLLNRARLRRRFAYSEKAVAFFIESLRQAAVIVTDLPEIQVVRDPEDDHVLAAALAAGAEYLVSRDKDLLVLGGYGDVKIVAPEAFLTVLRQG